MSPIRSEIIVVGAGVLGLSVAAELTVRGHDVLVVDPGQVNASAIAAGMIAPAFESLLDRVDDTRAALLRDAATLWPDHAKRHGLTLHTTPAEWRGPEAMEVGDSLTRLGFQVERAGEVVRAACDHRVEAEDTLLRLRQGLRRPLVVAEVTGLSRSDAVWHVETTGGTIKADAVVLATGAAAAIQGLPAAIVALVEAIQPIAGQIGRVESPLVDRVVRGRGGYVVPSGSGALIGATMVHGSRETRPNPEAGASLTEAAVRLSGRAVPLDLEWRGGVRGATADGLPLAGPVGDGLHLALAPRRNGWLLGPLVARVVVDGIEGRPPIEQAAVLHPLRFSPQAG